MHLRTGHCLAASIACLVACGQAPDKPAGPPDAGTGDTPSTDERVGPDATDTAPGTVPPADTGATYPTMAPRVVIFGEATVVPSQSYLGTETYRVDDLKGGAFCEVVYQAQDLASAPVSPTPSTAVMEVCAYGSVPCAFAFDLVHFDPLVSPGSDCEAFDADPSRFDAPAFVVPQGLVQDYVFTGTSTTGKPFSIVDSLLMYWIDYDGPAGSYVGWYPAPDSAYAVYYGFPDTTFEDGAFAYTRHFAYYLYEL